jgi:hypothetical protein
MSNHCCRRGLCDNSRHPTLWGVARSGRGIPRVVSNHGHSYYSHSLLEVHYQIRWAPTTTIKMPTLLLLPPPKVPTTIVEGDGATTAIVGSTQQIPRPGNMKEKHQKSRMISLIIPVPKMQKIFTIPSRILPIIFSSSTGMMSQRQFAT